MTAATSPIDLDRVTVRDLARAAQALHIRPSELYPILPVPEPIATPDKMALDREDGLIDMYGYCAPWCYFPRELTEDGRDHGHTVADHGTMCRQTVGWIESQTSLGEDLASGAVSVVRPYFHGTYEQGQIAHRGGSMIEVDFDPDGDGCKHYLTVGEARRMVAFLQYAVDELDGLHKTLSRKG